MKRFSLVLATCIWAWGVGLVVLSMGSGPGTGTLRAQDSASAAPAAVTPASSPAPLRAAGAGTPWGPVLEACIKGQFQEALADMKKAASAAPQDQRLAEGRELLEQYLERYKKWDNERQQEFDRSADRVRQSLLTQEHLAALAAAKIDKPLREKLSEMDQQMARIANADWLEQASSEKAAEMRTRAAEVAEKMFAALEGAVKLLKDDTSPYGKAFREEADKTKTKIGEFARAWVSVSTATPKDLRAAARVIGPVEEDLSDALGNVEVFASDQPWRVGLAQARLARTVAPGKDGMNEYSWYKDLVLAVTSRGQDAMRSAKWYDALNVYNGLHELDPDNETFRDQLKIARRHVRVLGLYGRKPDAITAIKVDANVAKAFGADPNKTIVPTAPPSPLDEPDQRWQELTEGVDADIVHNVIAQLDEQYVSAVDYRKLTRGALAALKVLAETPEAANSFEGLADAAKKKIFLDAVNREVEGVEKSDRVDSVYLSIVLNSMLRASEKSVNIPVGVLAMEFTDGFLDELDRFSSMIWPAEVDDFNKQTMGQFYGVGIQISKEANEPLKVVSPLADSPAFREGIKSGDLILTVDGKRTEALTVDKLVRMIQGPKGTKVVLTVRSRGEAGAREVTLVRDEIRIHTVKGWRLEPGGDGDNWSYWVNPEHKIAYVRLSQFTGESPKTFDKVLALIKDGGCQSLILDLRFNPGGLLDASRQIVDEFIEGVRRILVTRGRQKVQKEYLSSEGGSLTKFTKGNLVVMVNEMSASASEIVSGALQDCNRALILGQRSYGKGSVQNVLQISRHNAYLKLTTAYYYLPSGRLLHRKEGEKTWGVDPQVEVRMTPRQARRWLSIQRKTDLLQDIDPKELTADLAEEYKADFQLETAVLLLKMMQLQEAAPAPEAVTTGLAASAPSGT